MPENKSPLIIGIVVALAAIAAGVYYFRDQFGDSDAAPAATIPAATSTEEIPTIQHPLPAAEPTAEPPPPLAESDEAARENLSKLFSQKIQDFLVPDQVIRKSVASIDNLTRQKLAPRLNPVKPIGGSLVTTGTDQSLALSEDNYQRYAPFVQIISAADMKQVADTYVRFYPVFQEAYQELGYPDAYFNDRLVAVIDHLLVAPEVDEPILLKQPSVYYEFADPKLEALSVGQKAMVRMGPEQSRRVKAKLKEFRDHIASQKR